MDIILTACISAVVSVAIYAVVTNLVVKTSIRKRRETAIKEAEAEGEMIKKERILLEGDIPSAVDPPAGCRFCQRCFMAKPICFEQEPDMKTVGPDHCVRCHFAKEG